MLCDDIDRWDGQTEAREAGDKCIHIVDSLCGTVETKYNIVKQFILPT